MKLKTTFSILIFIFLFCQNLNSQSFVDEGNQWSLVSYAFNGNAYNSTYRIEGDTLINGIVHKKMWHTNEDPSIGNWTLEKIIREDSTQKVFQHIGIIDDLLIYDFGLSVGDTIFSNINPDEMAIVGAIDSIELNDGSKRKRLDLNSLTCPNLNDSEYWIEGIGGVSHAMSFIENFCATDIGRFLRCFSNDGSFLYGPTDGSTCFIINSTDEIEESKIKVFPNPTQDILNLEYDEMLKIEELNILNFNGQVIKSFQVENGFSQINISDFPIGVYYLKIETVKSEFVFKKFIKL